VTGLTSKEVSPRKPVEIKPYKLLKTPSLNREHPKQLNIKLRNSM